MSKSSAVAEFISQCIPLTGKTQKEIADEVGFDSPNVITMLKKGHTKLPLGKVGPLAKALEVDPVHLLKLCLSEYQPDTWEAVREYFDAALTKDEMALLSVFREYVGAPFVAALTQEQKQRLSDFLNSMKNEQRTACRIQ